MIPHCPSSEKSEWAGVILTKARHVQLIIRSLAVEDLRHGVMEDIEKGSRLATRGADSGPAMRPTRRSRCIIIA